MKSKIEKNIFNLMNAYAIASNLPEGNPSEVKLKASEMAMYVNSLVDLFHSQSQPEKKRRRLEDLTDEELKKVGITKTEDTPEEWEEGLIRLISTGEQLENGRKGIKCRYYAVDYVKQLLDDREREAEKNLLKRFYNVTSKEEFRDVLDKLNSKKK